MVENNLKVGEITDTGHIAFAGVKGLPSNGGRTYYELSATPTQARRTFKVELIRYDNDRGQITPTRDPHAEIELSATSLKRAIKKGTQEIGVSGATALQRKR